MGRYKFVDEPKEGQSKAEGRYLFVDETTPARAVNPDAPIARAVQDERTQGSPLATGMAYAVKSLRDGAHQLVARGADAFGLLPKGYVSELDKDVAEDRKYYDALSDVEPNAAYGNVAGQAAMFAPALAYTAPARGAGAFAAYGRYGLQGAGVGAVQPVTQPDNFGTAKAVQVVAGTALSPAAVKAMSATGNVTGGAAREIGKWLSKITRSSDDSMLSAFKEYGIDLQALPVAGRAMIASQASKVLSQAKNLTPDQASRLARLKALGIENPPRGVVTKTADDTRLLLRLARLDDKVKGAMDDMNNKLVQNLDDLQTQLGGRRIVDSEDFGDDMIRVAQMKAREMDEAVTNIYKAVREGADETVSIHPNRVQQAIDEWGPTTEAGITPQVKAVEGIMKKLEDDGLSILNAETLRKRIGALITDTRERTAKRALIDIKNALDEDVLTQAGQTFEPARRAAAANFRARENVDGSIIQGMIDGDIPGSKVFDKFILRSTPKDFRKTMVFLRRGVGEGAPEQRGRGRQALMQIKGESLEWLIKQSVRETVDGSRIFNPRQLGDAMRRLGDKKLNRIFSKDELKSLRAIRQAGQDIRLHQGFGNSPGTAAENLSIAISVLENLPVAGPLVVAPLKRLAKDTAHAATVKRALDPKWEQIIQRKRAFDEMVTKMIPGGQSAVISAGQAALQPDLAGGR